MKELNELVELAKEFDASTTVEAAMAINSQFKAAATRETILAIAEAFLALERQKESAEHERDCHMDIVEHFKENCRELVRRAEAAEAKLAELERQEPVAYSWRSLKKAQLTRTMPESWKQPRDIKPLFTRPAPAIDLAELVPDSDVQSSIDKLKNGYFRRWIKEYSSKEAKSGYVAGSINVKDIVNVFNYADACAAILRKIEEAK